MATCVDHSTNHTMLHQMNPTQCNLTDLIHSFITLRRLKTSDLCNTTNKYACSTENFNNSCKATPQEGNGDSTWVLIRREAERDITQEPLLEKYFNSAILSHTSLESALANHLALKLSDANLSNDTLYPVLLKILLSDYKIRTAVREDLKAVKDRDPACTSYVHCLLNFKGFLACQAHRLAHSLWIKDRNVLAHIIQSRVSEIFAVDIHPGAKIGHGIVFDHGTGIVIGETAVVGNNVTILHNVTLGGTGKGNGDRHPKIGDGVMIGTGAMVLGNIRIGDNSKIGAGTVVLKDVPTGATAVGNPARLIGVI